MDRNPRERPKCGERRGREASRVERLMEGGVELVLHVGKRYSCALERVEDGPVFGARIKCDEVTGPVVPRPTTCGDGGNSGVP